MLSTLLRPILLITFSVFFILLSLFLYTKLAGPIPFSVTSVTTQKTDTFSVSGEGRAKITPDSATVSVGVQAEGATAQVAQSQMNENINKVVNAIKALGIPEKDIQTENYNVYEAPEDIRPLSISSDSVTTAVAPKQAGTRYMANTNISVKVQKIDLANKVLDVATQNGATQVGGVQFDTEDKSSAENEARQKAVEDAKKKAETAAKAAGFQLGKIINYTENAGGGYPVAYDMKMEAAGRTSAPTQVQPGENELVISVTLFYEVR